MSLNWYGTKKMFPIDSYSREMNSRLPWIEYETHISPLHSTSESRPATSISRAREDRTAAGSTAGSSIVDTVACRRLRRCRWCRAGSARRLHSCSRRSSSFSHSVPRPTSFDFYMIRSWTQATSHYRVAIFHQKPGLHSFLMFFAVVCKQSHLISTFTAKCYARRH